MEFSWPMHACISNMKHVWVRIEISTKVFLRSLLQLRTSLLVIQILIQYDQVSDLPSLKINYYKSSWLIMSHHEINFWERISTFIVMAINFYSLKFFNSSPTSFITIITSFSLIYYLTYLTNISCLS